MKFEVRLRDVVIVALIVALAFVTFARMAKIEAAIQTAALVKTVNDHDAVIRKIVEYLNGKAAVPGTPTKAPVQTPPAK